VGFKNCRWWDSREVKAMYGYQCEYCEGTVRPRKIEHEAFKHKNGFIILENVTVGICDVCGNRYYSADIIHAVHENLRGENRNDSNR
jgi:YgiT-type zinc finger domain-containing protein